MQGGLEQAAPQVKKGNPMSNTPNTAITPAPVTVLTPAVAPPAKPAKIRKRHVGFIFSFFLFVIAPTFGSIYYLFGIADDQYSSRVSFSIRSEEFKNPLDALSGIGQLSTGTSSDAGILNEYIRSQKLIEDIEKNLDLRTIYSKPEFDPVFAFNPDKPIEDLLKYWSRMTNVAYDAGSGLIDVTAYAFTAEDAHKIAVAVMNASSDLVNTLSSIARDDTTRLALFELERARERLEASRVELGTLRDNEQIIDPRVDLQSRMGVLTVLQQELAEAVIADDLLGGTTKNVSDPRREALRRRIVAIEDRIAQERDKIGRATSGGSEALATVVGKYESLLADREFAEQAYLAAAASYDAALAEARRKSRYLAAHVPPTQAESSQYPRRYLISIGVFGTAFLFWIIGLLSVYATLDRR